MSTPLVQRDRERGTDRPRPGGVKRKGDALAEVTMHLPFESHQAVMEGRVCCSVLLQLATVVLQRLPFFLFLKCSLNVSELMLSCSTFIDIHFSSLFFTFLHFTYRFCTPQDLSLFYLTLPNLRNAMAIFGHSCCWRNLARLQGDCSERESKSKLMRWRMVCGSHLSEDSRSTG